MPRTGENIYKRKDGRWEARYIYLRDEFGKPKYKSIYGKTYSEVKNKKMLATQQLLESENMVKSQNVIFRDLAYGWLDNAKLHVKESTYSIYVSKLNKYILPLLGKYPVLRIDSNCIRKFVVYLLESGKNKKNCGLSPKTIDNILMLIKSVLKFGNFHTTVDLKKIKLVKEDKNIRILEKTAQIKLHKYLINNCDNIKIGILISLHTGIRIGEICALRWKNIDIERQTLRIEETIQRIQVVKDDTINKKTKIVITPPKSKKSIRTIPLPEELITLLKNMQLESSLFILTGSEAYMEPRTMHNHFKKCLKEAGIDDFNFHSLRHTFATNYVEAGFDIKSLSEILGHSNVKITLERYVHSTDRLKQANIEYLFHQYYLPSELSSLC